MTASIATSVVMIGIAVFAFSAQNASSQIPTACAEPENLQSQECCPNDCGEADNHGTCTDIGNPSHSTTSSDVRGNWPHYFTRACACRGNYGGYDCSRCQYGYHGSQCEQKLVLPRKSLQSLTEEEWEDYVDTLQQTRSYDSGYTVVLDKSPPGSPDLRTSSVTLYQLFVWQHHYTARNNEDGLDYAHESTGFPTWHRHYLLWLEFEIQEMLRMAGREDYYTFRLHYWDWREEDRTYIFERLSIDILNWNTYCWYRGNNDIIRSAICDPNIETAPLNRCPSIIDDDNNTNPCTRNYNWPTTVDVDKAISMKTYDTADYDRFSIDSFRNFMEGFKKVDSCGEDRLCKVDDSADGEMSVPLQRQLHNAVHIIVGIGYFGSGVADENKGVMADVAASPNDPIFINHHTMVDCILEEWLQRNPDATYPDIPSASAREGHLKDDYIVPFFPLVKHKDLLKTADNFGYSCSILSTATVSEPATRVMMVGVIAAFIMHSN